MEMIQPQVKRIERDILDVLLARGIGRERNIYAVIVVICLHDFSRAALSRGALHGGPV